MPSKADRQAAYAICAAIIGAGFASGREIVSFFSCFGSASWLGVAAASAAVGAIVYAVMKLARLSSPESFPSLYGTLMGPPCRDAVHILHGLLCLFTASSMLAAGGELGALAFTFRNARAAGLLITLSVSLIGVCSGFRSLSAMGCCLIPLVAVYYLTMIPGGPYSTPHTPECLPAACCMGLIYASFNGALAGGAVCTAAQNGASPLSAAVLTGGILFFLLSTANAALLRAGDAVRQMTLPSVFLTGALGIRGYYLSIIVLWTAILTTLCAMQHTLRAQFISLRIKPSVSLLLTGLIPSVLSVFGFGALIDTVYPLLGWVCSFVLVALFFFLPDSETDDLPPES